MKRNKFGCPLGIILTPGESTKLLHARRADARKDLTNKHLEEVKTFFLKQYPDPKKVKAAAAADADDLLGEPTLDEMKEALQVSGETVSPSAKPATIKKKYAAMNAAEAGE